MKVLMIFADGFEDVEAIVTRDVLIRAGIEVVDARINDKDLVVASHKLHLTNFVYLGDVNLKDFKAVILPGGSRGVNNLLASQLVLKVVKEAHELGLLISAICAAPMVLGEAGLLTDKRFTCYPGCEEGLDGIYTGEEVVVLDNMITARSMLYSIPFGLAIIEKLLGKDRKEVIYRQIAGLK